METAHYLRVKVQSWQSVIPATLSSSDSDYQPAQIQEEGDETPPLKEKNVKEFLAIFNLLWAASSLIFSFTNSN